MEKTTVVIFLNTCYACFRKIEFPLLSDFSYGELLIQTEDGQDFYYTNLTTNKTFEFVLKFLKLESMSKYIDPQKVLILLADNKNNKAFATTYPICPYCQQRQKHFKNNKPKGEREVEYATWECFEKMTEADKIIHLNVVIQQLI